MGSEVLFAVLAAREKTNAPGIVFPEAFKEQLKVPRDQTVIAGEMLGVISQCDVAGFTVKLVLVDRTNCPLLGVVQFAPNTLPAGNR